MSKTAAMRGLVMVISTLTVLLSLPSGASAEEINSEFFLEHRAFVLGEPERSILASPFGNYVCEPPLFSVWQEGEGAPLRFKTLTSQGSANGACFPGESAVPLEMHGCQFEFIPGEAIEPGLSHGTVKLEPSGCGPLTSKTLAQCPVSIIPNSWKSQAVSFVNQEAGGRSWVEVSAELKELEFIVTSGTFCPKNTYRATWTIHWALGGQGEKGEPTDLWVADPEGGSPPRVSTNAASELTSTSASLNGSVTPMGLNTSYKFEYGPSTAYGSVIPPEGEEAGFGLTQVGVSESIGGLAEATTYHYRLVAETAPALPMGKTKRSPRFGCRKRAPKVPAKSRPTVPSWREPSTPRARKPATTSNTGRANPTATPRGGARPARGPLVSPSNALCAANSNLAPRITTG
jgi:hypothetical protein